MWYSVRCLDSRFLSESLLVTEWDTLGIFWRHIDIIFPIPDSILYVSIMSSLILLGSSYYFYYWGHVPPQILSHSVADHCLLYLLSVKMTYRPTPRRRDVRHVSDLFGSCLWLVNLVCVIFFVFWYNLPFKYTRLLLIRPSHFLWMIYFRS